ncbi:prephenate dehydrogenase [Mycena leptocephala]|nr:prephenate dehydrogenase [Mycena leptocephala]
MMSSFPLDVSPASPADAQPTIGLIGMGAMGRMYAQHLSQAGWKKIHNQPGKYDALKREYAGVCSNITVLHDGHGVSRSSDFIIYSVQAEFIERVVAQFGPSTKVNAIVAGQTSVKAPERAAFEKVLASRYIHHFYPFLHGPTNILRSFGSRFVYLSYEEHDLVTANTQGVIHAAFLRHHGDSRAARKVYPWEQGNYVGGIETANARVQIDQFANSVSDLFKLMLEGDVTRFANAFCGRSKSCSDPRPTAKRGAKGAHRSCSPEDVLDRFSLGRTSPPDAPTASPRSKYKANSHLSLLAMVDCWAHLEIKPFLHLALAATPLRMLDGAIHSAMHDTWHRSDDLEFVVAARGWSQCVSFGSFELYRRRFEETRVFFEGRFEEAGRLGSEMIKAVMESEVQGQNA